jgi:hypothetical protein
MINGRHCIAPLVITTLLIVGAILALVLPVLRTIYATEIDAWWTGVLKTAGIPTALYYAIAVPLSVALIWWRFRK